MPKNHFDRVAKDIAEEALRSSGVIHVGEEILPETLAADLSYVPAPDSSAERARLGLLGRLVVDPCLLEFYSAAPSAAEVRACLTKHLAMWQRRVRERRRRKVPPGSFVHSSLWIIAAGAPRAVLRELKAEADPWPECPKGVYTVGGDVLRVGIVVASELPRKDESTLLVRLLAAGPLLPQAVAELAALPADAVARVIAEPALLRYQQSLAKKPTEKLARDEKEFIMAMIKSWEEGRAEARAEGRAEARAQDVLAVLRVRGIAVPDAARERILAQKDLEQLTRWHEKAVVASTIGEVLSDPS